ncbi:MAG: insulinase family protein, partial [Muribaculaceae bacterium]|nr:insulinase family protein [Muribaculaceae bacterium]
MDRERRRQVRTAEPTVTYLDGGLRLVHIHRRTSNAGIFGIAVRAGSADERPGEEGLAHFVEHTIFKGTRKRSSWHIINRM